MKNTIKNLLLSAGAGLLLAGCATKGTDSCCDDGATNCPAKTVKTVEYEYKTVTIGVVPGDVKFIPPADKLNEASQGGWRLVSTADGQAIFERLKQ